MAHSTGAWSFEMRTGRRRGGNKGMGNNLGNCRITNSLRSNGYVKDASLRFTCSDSEDSSIKVYSTPENEALVCNKERLSRMSNFTDKNKRESRYQRMV